MNNRSEWLIKNPSKKTAYQRKWLTSERGIAYRERHKEYMKEWRRTHKEQFHRNQKRAYDKMRYECLAYYSKGVPKCSCCGETEILFLHIDHINGDGANHRREMVKEQGYISGGNNLPYWLKKKGYPNGFQVLCANCNLGKRLNKDCPHKSKEVKL